VPKNILEPPESAQSDQEHKATPVRVDNAAAQDTLRNVRLIVGREFKNQVNKRGFRISSIILLVVVFVAAFIPTISQLISERTSSQTRVVFVNEAGTIAGLDDSALGATIGSILNGTGASGKAPYAIAGQPASDLGGLQSQVKGGKLGILLVLERGPNQDLRFTYSTRMDATSDRSLARIQTLAGQLSFLDSAVLLGLTPAQTSSLLAAPNLTVVRSQGDRPSSQIVVGFVLAFAGALMCFMTVMAYANTIAGGIAEEKGSRVMEILVNAATPIQLLVGKVAGIGAACLAQMGSLVVVGIGGLLLQSPIQTALFGADSSGFSKYLTGVTVPFYLLFLVYFVLNFLLYALLFAGLGAMVRRQEDVQSAVQAPTMLLVSGWILVYLGVAYPNAVWLKVLSYVPFVTPEMMMVRLAMGTVAWWEIVTTVAALLAAIAACAWFSARAYRMGILMYGQPPGLRRLWKMVRTG
jgi:ABC-2 type transport system permease protein